MKAQLFNKYQQSTAQDVNDELIEEWRSNDDCILWLDVEGVEDIDSQLLKSQFNLNDLAIKDSIRERHPPKFEVFDNNAFVLLRSVELSKEDNDISFSQLSLFAGDRYIITRHLDDVNVLNNVWSNYSQNKQTEDTSVRKLLYGLFRCIADQYVEIIINIESRLESIEDALDKDKKDTYLSELISINTGLRKIVRNLEYMAQVSKKGLKYFTLDNKFIHEFNDVYEQVERALSLAKMYQALCTDLMNAYISVTSHRVNKVVKILTIVTVLFVPLGFIAGLYGMNFEYMPELKHHYGYFYVIGLMVLIEISLIVLLKKLKWF